MLTPSERDLVQDAIDIAYQTTDFEFVAFALVNQDPKVKLHGLSQIAGRLGKKDQSDSSIRYTFLLLPEGVDIDRELWHSKMEDLAFDYVNQRTSVEPTALAAMRKNLRGMVLQKKKTMRRSGP